MNRPLTYIVFGGLGLGMYGVMGDGAQSTGQQPIEYSGDRKQQMYHVLTGGGPASLAKLSEDTAARRKQIAKEYSEKEYARVLALQEAEKKERQKE